MTGDSIVLVAAVARRHGAASRTTMSLRALVNHDLICLPRGAGIRASLDEGCHTLAIPPPLEGASMPKTIRLIVIAMACVGVAACASQQPSPPNATGPSTTKPPTTTRTAVSPSTPTSTPACIGLSICPPPPPDAEGNPPCYYADGWQANASGTAIEVWYFHEPQNMSKPDKITAVVRKKDGTTESQDANIEAGQQVHHFEFPNIDKSVVEEVLLTTSNGRCFVIGPDS